jgi:methionine-rich copper-binding protein CopC
MRTLKTTLVLASGLLLSNFAQAHPKLLSSIPAEGADGPAPGKIELHFSESLVTQFSGAKLVMTGWRCLGFKAFYSSWRSRC